MASCQWKQVELLDCSLSGVSFFQTPLSGLDLTSCRLEGLILSQDGGELRGAVVDRWQAAELAKRMGLVIKE